MDNVTTPGEGPSTGWPADRARTIPVTQQATGAFDRGKITERKPIGMPHDFAPQKGIGPLFYWAWAKSDESGTIAMHPHQGFEILSYVLEGEMFHRDTLGSEGWISAGGAQVQQAGSGMSHEEITAETRTEFFQIWFQPDLKAALERPAEYGGHVDGTLPVAQQDGTQIKTILGEGSPITLVSDAQMHDVTVNPGSVYGRRLESGRALIAVAVEGDGEWRSADSGQAASGAGRAPDQRTPNQACTIVLGPPEAGEAEGLELSAAGDEPVRIVLIEVPLDPGYPLYR